MKRPFKQTDDTYEVDKYTYTGLDDTSNFSPDVLNAVRAVLSSVAPTDFGDKNKRNIYSTISAAVRDAERNKDLMRGEKGSLSDEDYQQALTSIPGLNKAVIGVLEKANKADKETLGKMVNILTSIGGNFKDKNMFQQLDQLKKTDFGRVRDIMKMLNISKEELVDLVRAPEGATNFDKIKAAGIRRFLRGALKDRG
jgi:hypothetical protein